MRTVWVDQGQPAQDEKLRAAGITRAYFDARDTPKTTTLERGVYRVQSWNNLPPAGFALALSNDVHAWGGDAPGSKLAIHANIELHDAAYLVSFVRAWRRLRPTRETALVVEGLQGGWFTAELRAIVNADKNLTVVAEAYTGSMDPIDADLVRTNLVDYGITRGKAVVFYDAARLPAFWDGCAFTQQRLP